MAEIEKTANIIVPGAGKLAYREAGAGPPLILIHGSPTDGRSWWRLVPRLAEYYRVIAPDLPGHGGSNALRVNMRERTAAIGAVIGALVDSCGERVRLCGHSYGGNVALHAAIARRSRVERLVLLEPAFFRAMSLTGEHQAFEQAFSFFSAYADRVTGGDPAAVGQMIDYWFGAGTFVRMPQPTRKFLIAKAAANGVDVRAAFAERLTIDQLASFTNPVLIVYGGASPPAAPALARELAKLIPKARSHALPGASHGMVDTHPDAVANLILSPEEAIQ